jgi:hypothetical protein
MKGRKEKRKKDAILGNDKVIPVRDTISRTCIGNLKVTLELLYPGSTRFGSRLGSSG